METAKVTMFDYHDPKSSQMNTLYLNCLILQKANCKSNSLMFCGGVYVTISWLGPLTSWNHHLLPGTCSEPDVVQHISLIQL